VPLDVGQTVNGYQDDFNGTMRNSNWVAHGPGGDSYVQESGVLKVTTSTGDPNHLLYEVAGYNDAAQEVLARIKINSFGSGDYPRGGISVGIDPDSSRGINLMFRDSGGQAINGVSRHFRALDDFRAWGPGFSLEWKENTWYWLRLRQTASNFTNGDNIQAKVWLADGTVPEPADWPITWGRADRTGFAGIAGSSGGGAEEFEVDYILIKAAGLPSIKVAPGGASAAAFVNITQQPQSVTVGGGRGSVTATFSVTALASASSLAYQWQKAAPGTTNFTNIAGATSASYTTPALADADNGTKYRVLVTIPGISNTSAEATLTVDVTLPSIAGVSSTISFDHLTVFFSEPVTESSATNLSNYAINGLTISAASLSSGGMNVVLQTGKQNPLANYTLTIKDVQDLVGNKIAANTQIPINLAMGVPVELGQTVSGFQDDFSGAVRDPNWIPAGPAGDIYEQAKGVLKVKDATGDPNHLLYTAAGYDDAEQEVLARIKVNAFGNGDYPRGGIGVGVSPDSSQGINVMFRNSGGQAIAGRSRHFRLLDDFRAWGPGFRPELPTIDWTTNAWYWLRLRQTRSTSSAGNNIQAKVWPADGTVPEPDDWQLSWGRNDRTGFAGIAGPSSTGATGIEDFEVDYILIKATGLPSIKVAPSAFSGFQFIPIPFITITKQPQDVVVPKGQTATFTIEFTASASPVVRWQRASPGSTNFVDVAGATTSSYTTPVLTEGDNGVKFRVVISLPGGSKTSREAIAITDVVKPTLVSARTLGNPNKVTVVFSEPVQSNVTKSNFAIDNGIGVTGVAPGLEANAWELTTTTITLGKSYTLTVNGIRDLVGNEILPSSQIGVNLFVELPADFGQTVNGFQDDFNAAVRDPNWIATGPGGDLYEQAGGVLKVTATTGDPNHLLYTAPGYNDSVQEVLARIRVKSFGIGDNPRGGIGVGVSPDNGQGIELHFRNSDFSQAGTRFRLLDDFRAWGPAIQTNWATNAWFWLRLRQSGSGTAAGDNLKAKVWLGDGSVSEPSDWQASWRRADRTGFAGITGSSGGGNEEFEVDYILIKADGLPSVKPAAASFSLVGPPPSVLKFSGLTRTTGNRVLLEWIGTASLEQADNVTGPWTAVTGASSPLTITVSGTAKFYRLRQ
jgi:hypothetical protein